MKIPIKKYLILILGLFFLAQTALGQLDKLSNADQNRVVLETNKLNNLLSQTFISDEEANEVFDILYGKTAEYRKALEESYRIQTKRELANNFDRLNFEENIRARLLLTQGSLSPVDQIALGLPGAGTDLNQVFRGLYEIRELRMDVNEANKEWKEKYGENGDLFQRKDSILNSIYQEENSSRIREPVLRLLNNEYLTDADVAEFSYYTGQKIEDLKKNPLLYNEGKTGEVIGPIKGSGEDSQDFLLKLEGVKKAYQFRKTDCGPRGDGGYVLCVPLPGAGSEVAGLTDYVKYIFQFILGAAGLVVLVRIVYGGIKYTVSAGNSSTQREAREIMTDAGWGLILLFTGGIILRIINPDILTFGERLERRTERVNTVAPLERIVNKLNEKKKGGVNTIPFTP